MLANWIINDFKGLLKKHGLTADNCGIDPQDFRILIWLHWVGYHSKEEVRAILDKQLATQKEI